MCVCVCVCVCVCAVLHMAVFCSPLTSDSPGTLFRYFVNDFEMVPVAPIITGIAFVFTFLLLSVFILRSLFLFRIFSTCFLITFFLKLRHLLTYKYYYYYYYYFILLLSSSTSSSSEHHHPSRVYIYSRVR